VLRSVFGPKKEEETRERRKLLSEELQRLCSSPNIIRVTKSMEIQRAIEVTRTGEMRNTVYKKC
jgi:hypothetical protein